MPPEAAVAAPAAPAAPAATPAAGTPPAAASAALTAVPSGEWFGSFKSPELKAYIQEKNFSDPEKLAESYQNLEKLKGVPENRLLKLPEKLEGEDLRPIFERLGTPKDPKGYEIPRDEKSPDPGFADWAEGAFHKSNLTKAQAQSLTQEYQGRIDAEIKARNDAQALKITQADTQLKKEWGAQYDANINVVKQGVKILGLDAKTLDLLEAVQGRDVLFKNLQRIGVSVGESNFVDGQGGPAPVTTPEQAQAQIKTLMQDQKFVKKINRGDQEALKTWNDLNRIAAPGEKSIG